MIVTPPRFAVLLTCFNRRETTLTSLTALYQQNTDLSQMDVYLVDDGSTDGTAQAVNTRFPEVKILQGNGNLFWNRGMHLAFLNAHTAGYDYYLWLNDDTHLYTDAFSRLFSAYTQAGKAEAIIVGTTLDPETNRASYGGYKRISNWHPSQFELVNPGTETPHPCDTMCGNCVLIPRQVVDKIGLINPHYHHRWGDVDYGLRAARAGCSIYVATGFIGECGFNHQSNVWENKELALKKRVKAINSIKGLHKEDWKYYNKQFGGPLWVLFWLSPYLKLFLTSLFNKPTAN